MRFPTSFRRVYIVMFHIRKKKIIYKPPYALTRINMKRRSEKTIMETIIMLLYRYTTCTASVRFILCIIITFFMYKSRDENNIYYFIIFQLSI